MLIRFGEIRTPPPSSVIGLAGDVPKPTASKCVNAATGVLVSFLSSMLVYTVTGSIEVWFITAVLASILNPP